MRTALVLLFSLFCLGRFPLPALAESAAGLIARGNKAYEAGDFAGAKAAYDKAAEMNPAAPEPDFNRGAVLFRQNNFEGARAASELAVGKATDPLLVAQSKYNIGNAFLKQAEALPAQDTERALGLLQQGADYFQQALSLDAGFADAARNLEITRQRLVRLQEEAQKATRQDAGGLERPEAAENKHEEARGEAPDEQAAADQQKDQAGGEPDNKNANSKGGETREEKEESLTRAGQDASPPLAEEGEEIIAAPSRTAADILNREKSLQRLRMKRQAAELPVVNKDW